jgi:hypothetical protein
VIPIATSAPSGVKVVVVLFKICNEAGIVPPAGTPEHVGGVMMFTV